MPGSPKFKKPPIVETVLSAQFDMLPEFRIAHFGILWEKFRSEFPLTEEHPAVPPISETFSKRRRFAMEPTQRWKFSSNVELPRVLYKKNATVDGGKEMIQVQSDRFVHNWARPSIDQQPYPTYKVNRGQFLDAFRKFSDFVGEQKLGSIVPNLAEVTYINRISIRADQKAGEVVKASFPGITLICSDNFLPPTESFGMEQTFPIDGERGRLQVSVRGPVELTDEQEVVDFRLTARVGPGSTGEISFAEMLDTAHTWVVNGFKSLTSEAMHHIWEVVDD